MSDQSVRRNAMVMFIGRGISAATALLFVTVVPRVLGPADYGYYSYWFAQLFLLFTIFDLGTVDLIRRYLPNLIQTGSGESRTLIWKITLLKASFLPLALGLFLVYNDKRIFLYIFLGSVAAAFSYILSEINFAANRMVWYSVHHIMRKVIRFILVLVLFLAFSRPGIIWALVGTELVILAFFLVITKSALSDKPAIPLSQPLTRYLAFGILLYLSTLLFLSTGRLPVVIARFRGLSFQELGYLALVIDIFYFALRELFYGISESLLPMQAIHHAHGRFDELHRSFETALRYTLVILLPCLSFLAIWPREIVQIIGEKFLPAVPLFILFLPVMVFNVLSFTYRQILIIYEYKGTIFFINIMSALVFLVPALLISPVGIHSLALSVLAASSVNCSLMWAASRRILRIQEEGILFGKLSLAFLVFLISPLLVRNFNYAARGTMMITGLAGYAIFLHVTGIFRWNELSSLKTLFWRPRH